MIVDETETIHQTPLISTLTVRGCRFVLRRLAMVEVRVVRGLGSVQGLVQG